MKLNCNNGNSLVVLRCYFTITLGGWSLSTITLPPKSTIPMPSQHPNPQSSNYIMSCGQIPHPRLHCIIHTSAVVSCWNLCQHVLPTLTQLHTGFQTNSASPIKSFSPSNISSSPLALSNHAMDDTLLHAQGYAKGATFNILQYLSRVNFGTSTVDKSKAPLDWAPPLHIIYAVSGKQKHEDICLEGNITF